MPKRVTTDGRYHTLERKLRIKRKHIQEGEKGGRTKFAYRNIESGLEPENGQDICNNGFRNKPDDWQDISCDSDAKESINKRESAYEHYKEKKYSTSLKECNEAIELNKENNLAYLLLGKIYLAICKPKKALIALKRSVELYPESLHDYWNMGRTYIKLEKFKDAKACLRQALKIISKNGDDSKYNLIKSEILSSLGRIYEEKKEFDKALNKYAEAVLCSPENPNIYKRRAILYNNMRNYDLAIEDADRAIELGLKISTVYQIRARVFYNKEDFKSALQNAKKAWEIEPGSPKTKELINLCYFQLNKFSKTIR
ncbi:MAG: tetratricopeptide repeat protein [Candidatus Micrarchaeota archaeon]